MMQRRSRFILRTFIEKPSKPRRTFVTSLCSDVVEFLPNAVSIDFVPIAKLIQLWWQNEMIYEKLLIYHHCHFGLS